MFIVSSGRDYHPRELRPNPLNSEIYGDEKADSVLIESLKQKGQIESVIIKEDKTIVSGHRRWLALKAMGADKIRCEVRAFDDELDEWETLIECNKQREKTRIQRANEIDKLRKIKEERARRKMKEAGERNIQNYNSKLAVQNSEQLDKPAFTFQHSEPSPTTALENIATIKIVSDGAVTAESKQVTRAELAAQINHLQDIKAMKAAKQLHESQKKAEEAAKRKEEEEAKRAEKAKRELESKTRTQIAQEVGSSKYEVDMLEKLKAKADSGSKMAEMALKDESISLNAGLLAVDIEEKAKKNVLKRTY